MIVYKTAVALKDAGFPQPNDRIYLPHDRTATGGYYYQGVFVPTLEELIEACGKGFFSLERQPWPSAKKHKPSEYQWLAFAGKKGIPNAFFEVGATPKEAVARLWIALHPPTTEVK